MEGGVMNSFNTQHKYTEPMVSTTRFNNNIAKRNRSTTFLHCQTKEDKIIRNLWFVFVRVATHSDDQQMDSDDEPDLTVHDPKTWFDKGNSASKNSPLKYHRTERNTKTVRMPAMG